MIFLNFILKFFFIQILDIRTSELRPILSILYLISLTEEGIITCVNEVTDEGISNFICVNVEHSQKAFSYRLKISKIRLSIY